jgi:hypothetical protein
MYRDLLRTPLQQAMVLLWLIGMAHLLARLAQTHLTVGWVFSAGLGGLVAALMAGRFRLLQWLPLPILVGLGTLLGALYTLGISSITDLGFAGVLYALLTWQFVVYALAQPITLQLAELLQVRGGHGPAGGRALVEQMTHWTALVLTVTGVFLLMGESPLFMPDSGQNPAVLLALVTGMIFLWLAGQRYRLIPHSYVLLTFVVFSALVLYAWAVRTASLSGLLADARLGLMLALLSLSMWIMAWALDRLADITDERTEFKHSLYRKPLRVGAVWLSLISAILQLGQVGLDPTRGIDSPSLVVLFLSSAGLLLNNHALRNLLLNLTGILSIVLALLWAEAWLLHSGMSFSLWPDGRTYGDKWLTLGLLAFGLAALSHYLSRFPEWKAQYAQPLTIAADLCYGWTLLSALALFVAAPLRMNAFLPWTFLVLVIGLLPVLRPLTMAKQIRGIGVALLLSAALVSFLPVSGLEPWLRLGMMAWAYALWGLAAYVLPRFNARWPQWAIAPDLWPWLGLLLVGSSLVSSVLNWPSQWGYLLATAGYLLLMLRNSAWAMFPWSAALAFTTAGIGFNLTVFGHNFWSGTALQTTLIVFSAGTLLWANLLLRIVPLWRHHGQALSARLGWHPHDLSAPFEFWPFVLLSLWLLALAFWDGIAIFVDFPPSEDPLWLSKVVLGVVLTLSFLHAFWLRQGVLQVHSFIFSLFCTVLAAYFATLVSLFHLSLLLTLWSAVLLVAHRLKEYLPWLGGENLVIRQALTGWLHYSPLFAIAALLLEPEVSLAERLLNLAALTGLAVALGLHKREPIWLHAAMVMLLVLLHAWPLLWVPLRQWELLLPWYALQLTGLSWCLLWCQGRLRGYMESQASSKAAIQENICWELGRLVLRSWPWLVAIAIVEWTLHEFILIQQLAAPTEPLWLAGPWDAVVALLTGLLLLGLGLRHATHNPNSAWIYGMVMLAGAIALYGRLLLLGAAPVTVWDTAALIAAAYALFILQRITLSEPLLHLAMLMPLFALLTVPMQLASTQASGALLATGILYLLLRRETGRQLPLYLGLLAFNIGLYLWVPGWANRSQLLQVYVIPAALSVLMLLHLHRRELKPSVLKGTRLAATGTLYASATLDVFLRPELGIFVLALILSLTGALVGITLRIRAFLYAGVSFLVLNVLGQLLRFYPEQRFGKAIVLMVLGAAITGAMIWFNMKREAILQRIRIFRADLEPWE